ncbi:kelch domain-containing protein 10-like [Oratosquilla oratoria]|uniref:kelch domain-containing protein 10-like n=1 Tax=Oratosquilla oratoria TaxID=337810 RepID=UPI003F769977
METVETSISAGGRGVQPPPGRSGHRVVCDDSYMYVYGGYHPRHGPFRQALRLNLFTSEWEEVDSPETSSYSFSSGALTPFIPGDQESSDSFLGPCGVPGGGDDGGGPTACISHCMWKVGPQVMTLGGTGFPFGSTIGGTVHVLDVDGGTWSALGTSGQEPSPMYGQAARRQGEYVYVVGGTSGYAFTLDAHALHLPTRTWVQLHAHEQSHSCHKKNSLGGRYRAEIGVIDGRIVVVGGASALQVFALDTVPVLEGAGEPWRLEKTNPDPATGEFPRPRRAHAATQLGTDLYVCGGTDDEEVFDDVWRLDLATMTWRRLFSLPQPLYFHDCAVTPSGCLYVFGGVPELGGCEERSDKVYRVWLHAPPLLEAAWGALSHPRPSASHIKAMSSADLLQAGVPRSLTRRLSRPIRREKPPLM